MYSYSGTQLSDKDDWTANPCSSMDKSHQHDLEKKKPDIKGTYSLTACI